ncbi:hypothetical protein KIPB_013131, partial [Kipferlia bialata]
DLARVAILTDKYDSAPDYMWHRIKLELERQAKQKRTSLAEIKMQIDMQRMHLNSGRTLLANLHKRAGSIRIPHLHPPEIHSESDILRHVSQTLIEGKGGEAIRAVPGDK